MSTYSDFLPLIRLLKIAGFGVADFTVGLTLACILDQAFDQYVESAMKNISSPVVSGKAEKLQQAVCEGSSYLGVKTFNYGNVTVQNPICAPMPILDATGMKVVGIATLAQLLV